MTTCARLLTWLNTALVAMALAATPAIAEPPPGKLDKSTKDAADQGGPDRVRVIVRMLPQQRGAVRGQAVAAGYDVKSEHPSINAITMTVPRQALNGLANNPKIASISIDADLHASQTSTPTSNSEVLRPTLGLTA